MVLCKLFYNILISRFDYCNISEFILELPFLVSAFIILPNLRDLEYLSALTDPFKFMQGTSEDEDDDFLKGETPQNDGVVEIAPNSYESNTRSPVSSIGSPPDCYVPYPQ